MQITITDQRTATLSSPEQFANGETTPLSLSALAGVTFNPDTASLALVLFDQSGNALAISGAFTSAGGGVYTATIDCKNSDVMALFNEQPVSYRAPINMVVADTTRLWVNENVVMTNNPLISPPIPPGPSLTYLTTADFAGVTIPAISDPFDTQIAFLRTIGNLLKGS